MRVPELVPAHALRRARAAAGRRRTIAWHLRQAQRADTVAARERLTLAARVPELPGAPDVAFDDDAGAYLWLESERHVPYGCVAMAYANGFDAWAWALCEPLWTHYLDHRHHADVLDAFRTGLAAAQRAEAVAAVVRMRCQLARPYWEQGRFDDAERELGQALSASTSSSAPSSRHHW
jgi:hypothetical protein